MGSLYYYFVTTQNLFNCFKHESIIIEKKPLLYTLPFDQLYLLICSSLPCESDFLYWQLKIWKWVPDFKILVEKKKMKQNKREWQNLEISEIFISLRWEGEKLQQETKTMEIISEAPGIIYFCLCSSLPFIHPIVIHP